MPIDYSDYPENWKTEIRPDILKRANNKCEKCGVYNYARGARAYNGIFVAERYILLMSNETIKIIFRELKIIKIILTIAHLDHSLDDHSYENLAAMCQKCHLNYDQEQHIESRKNQNEKR